MNLHFNKGKVILEKLNGAVKKIGKRNLSIICAVVLIAGAVVLNFQLFSSPAVQGTLYYQGQNGTQTGTDAEAGANGEGAQTDSYFASTMITRQRSRDEALAVLQTIVANETALPETVAGAIEQINQIAQDMENEANIETMVKAKGFEECVAVLSDGKCSVIVKTEGLLPSEVAQIQEIVYEQTGILPEHVKMIEKKG